MSKILEIITIDKNEKLLRTPSSNVSMEMLRSKEFQTFLDNMQHTLKSTKLEEGWEPAGLAAVQVGKPINVFLALDVNSREFVEYINAEVEIQGMRKEIGIEACLSIPEYVGKVERSVRVKVRYMDREGNKQIKKLSGFNAKVVQHEYDHTKGILFTDKLV